MSCLLFVDDDKNILEINQRFFTDKGFAVYTATGMAEAMACLEDLPVDCVILDILMPEGNGIAVCEKIRERKGVPILFLTGLTEKEFLYRGFAAGCDDYLTKPYDLLELEMRIIAAIKRHRGEVPSKQSLCFGPLTIDEARRCAAVEGGAIPLTSYEFDILLLLARHPGRMFPTREIYREIWQMPDLESTQTVQVHLGRMRHKLEQACPCWEFVKTTWKLGYRFEPTKKAKAD